MDQSRRDALKKGAAGAAILWAAPAVTTVGRAYGAVGTPPPCACTVSGFGLQVDASGSIRGVDIDLSAVSTAGVVVRGDTNQGVFVSANVLAPTLDEQTCSAETAVADLQIVLPGLTISAVAVRSEVDAPCDCSGSGSTTITDLVVNSALLVAGANVSIAPDTVILDSPLVRIVGNEQTCDGTTGVVNGLHITANITDPLGGPVTVDIIVAQAAAGNATCPCPF